MNSSFSDKTVPSGSQRYRGGATGCQYRGLGQLTDTTLLRCCHAGDSRAPAGVREDEHCAFGWGHFVCPMGIGAARWTEALLSTLRVAFSATPTRYQYRGLLMSDVQMTAADGIDEVAELANVPLTEGTWRRLQRGEVGALRPGSSVLS